MATFSKAVLSGSTSGRGIKVVATATPGTLIHTGSSTTSTLHEVWLYAVNTDAGTARSLTVQWGGVTAPDDSVTVALAPSSAGLVLIVPGLIVAGNATPLVIRAFASATNVVSVHGYVNVIA